VSSESNGVKTVEVVPDGEYRVVDGRKYGAGVKIEILKQGGGDNVNK